MRTVEQARSAIARLPHVGPARLVEDVRAIEEDRVETTGAVPARSAWIVRGRIPAYVALEFAAQSAAVFEIADAPDGVDDGPAERGFIVRARELRCLRADAPADAALRASVRLEGTVGALAMYRFEVRANDEPIADGGFSTYVERGG